MKRIVLLLLLLPIAAWCQFSNANRIWNRNIDSTAPTNGQVYVWNSSNNRWQLGAGGGVTPSGTLTDFAIVTGAGTSVVKTPSVTTTLDASGNISTPGTGSFGVGSGIAGSIALTQGTAPTAGTTNITLYAPAAVTSYMRRFAGAAFTGVPYMTNTAGDMVETSLSTSGTGTTLCLTVSCVGTGAWDLSGATSFKLPVAAGAAPATNGFIAYDSTAHALKAAINSTVRAMVHRATTVPTSGRCAEWGADGLLAEAAAACGSGAGAGATLFSTTASTTTVAAAATTLIGAVTGSTTIPVNTFVAGSVLEILGQGYYTSTGSRTLTIDLDIGGSTRITTGAVTVPAATTGTWLLRCAITTRTAGGSGTQIGNCTFFATGATLTAPAAAPMFTSSTWTVDTTATIAVNLTAEWDATTGDPTITATNVAAWIPGAPVSSVFGQTGAVGNLSGAVTTSGSSVTTLANDAVTTAKILDANVTAAKLVNAIRDGGFGVTFDGGGTVLTPGTTIARFVTLKAACTIVAFDITVDTGTATFKTWRVASGTALPTVSDSISTAGVAISSGTALHSTTVTDWTDTTLDALDIIGLNLSAVTGSPTVATFDVTCRR